MTVVQVELTLCPLSDQLTEEAKQADGPKSRCNVIAIRVPDLTASAAEFCSCNAGRVSSRTRVKVSSPIAITLPTTIKMSTSKSAEPRSRSERFLQTAEVFVMTVATPLSTRLLHRESM